ncbi:MAG: TRAP transporter small permease [Pseudomonadota bacterium]
MATLASSHAPDRPRTLFYRVVAALSTICGVAAAFMIVAAVAITCQMIWVRYLLNESTVWQTEVVIYLMVAATMIGLPYVQLLRGHVNVDLLPRLLPAKLRIFLACITFATSIAVIGVMTFYGFELWHIAWSRGWTSDTVWAAKLWVPYLALPVGFGLYLLQLFADFLAVMTRQSKPFDLEDDATLGST